jgi:hypothetical protein
MDDDEERRASSAYFERKIFKRNYIVLDMKKGNVKLERIEN